MESDERRIKYTVDYATLIEGLMYSLTSLRGVINTFGTCNIM